MSGFPQRITALASLLVCLLLMPVAARARESLPSATIKEDDSLRLMQLIDRSRPYVNRAPDSAIAMLTIAYRECRQKNFVTGTARALLGLGLAAIEKGRYKESITLLDAARPYCAASTFSNGNLLINWYNNAAIPYTFLGRFEEALAYYYQALLLCRSNPHTSPQLAGTLHNNIGSIWKKLGQFGNAFYHLKVAEHLSRNRIASDMEAADLYASACTNLSNYYSLHEKWDSASYYNREALRAASQWGIVNRIQAAHTGYGDILSGTGRTNEAIAAYLKAVAITDKTNPYLSKVEPYRFLAKLYYDRRTYDSSLYYARAALEIADRYSMMESRLLLHEQMALLAETRGDFRAAYRHKQEASHWLDSVINKEKTRAVHDYEIKYRSIEKDHRLSMQQLELVRRENRLKINTLFLAGISAGVLLLSVAAAGFYRSSRHRQKLQEEKIRNLEKDREIGRLRAMMEGEEQERSRIARELHDGIMSQLLAAKLSLGGTAAGDEGLVPLAGLREGLGFLDEAAADLRRTAHNLMPGMVQRAGLQAAVEDFCRKMEKGLGTKIHTLWCGQPPVAGPVVELSLYRMIQELVQNAVKHAGASAILVQITYSNELLGITVEDDGVGMNVENAGSGLGTIRERVTLLGGSTKLHTSPGNGTAVYIEIPAIALQNNDYYADQDSDYRRSPIGH